MVKYSRCGTVATLVRGRRWAVGAVAAVVLAWSLVSTTGRGGPSALSFGDRVTVPSQGEPVVISLLLDNPGDVPVQLTAVEAAGTEDLAVRYAGHSFCRQVCPGAVKYDGEWVARVRDLVAGQGPLIVPPAREVEAGRAEQLRLIFIARPMSPWTSQEVCRLAPPPAASIKGGGRAKIRYGGGGGNSTWVLGVTKKGVADPQCGD